MDLKRVYIDLSEYLGKNSTKKDEQIESLWPEELSFIKEMKKPRGAGRYESSE
jgi:hypothetical protein